MAALKCPNPSCPFLFDPTQVPPGAILTCPRCGMRFTLGPTAFQPPADPIPDAQPAIEESAPVATVAPPVAEPRSEPVPVEASRGGMLAIIGGVLLFGGIVFAVVLVSVVRQDSDDPPNGETSSTERTKSTARTGPETIYTSQLGKYRLSNFEKIWEPPPAEPKDEDEHGDLLLRGTYRKPGQSRMNLHSTAKLVVIVLEKSGDVDEASRYVRKRYDIEGSKDIAPTDFKDVTDEPLGETPPGDVKTNTPTTRLRVRQGGANADRASEKLIVYAVLKVGDDVILAEGSCLWADREVWERRLIQLVGSLRP